MALLTAGGQDIIGWDIGGAHLKAARVSGGRVVSVAQVACPLWLGLNHLGDAFDAIERQLGKATLHAVTMTGELADIFPNRAAGVAALADAASTRLAHAVVYAGRCGFISAGQSANLVADIASANWHATAAWAARHFGAGLLADMGSTTTDLIPLAGGRIVAQGYSDAERLESGELIYTGALRTSLMAISDRAPFRGRMRHVMAEHFATMADVNRILARIDTESDQYPAADGAGKTLAECRRRLARLLGEDDLTEAEAGLLADWFAERQLRKIHDSATVILSGYTGAVEAPLIGCGAGKETLRLLATRLNRPLLRLSAAFPIDLNDTVLATWAETCAPAVAVALLAGDPEM